ncbi:Oidioi.mRNA.OKI2018_I69.chr2.g8181.t1.cds [Oikopleura dioica]|uniref:Oidioi.mRNA.OKI2018_I69.chr2.g8181.t1.cds n=1 Tax=Oikopleura dioica TaxID=34765 RepID=A0ABN7T8H0_OIKDI|nr:Oidioi.mRNA.OKI2018_I69.chr2.g8181.t1.cds [Oikopleura dioica]
MCSNRKAGFAISGFVVFIHVVLLAVLGWYLGAKLPDSIKNFEYLLDLGGIKIELSVDSLADLLDTQQGLFLGRNVEELTDLLILIVTLVGIVPLAMGLLASFSVFMSLKMNSSCCKCLTAMLSVLSAILYFIVMGVSIAMLVVIFNPAVRGLLDDSLSDLTRGVSGAGENLAGVLTRNRRQINEDLATELANSEYGQFIQEIDLNTFEAAVKEQAPNFELGDYVTADGTIDVSNSDALEQLAIDLNNAGVNVETLVDSIVDDVLTDLNVDTLLADSGIEKAFEEIGSAGVGVYGFLFFMIIFTGCFGCQVQGRKVSHI